MLWSIPTKYIPEIRQRIQSSTYTPFDAAIDLIAKIDAPILIGLIAYILILALFLILLLAFRNNPEHFVTRLSVTHRRKIIFIGIFTLLIFFGVTMWLYIYPVAVQSSMMVSNLAALRKNH